VLAWRRHTLTATATFVAFALAAGLISLAIAEPRHDLRRRLPFTTADPALAMAGVLVLAGIAVLLRDARRP
jgi:hypothetical protein